MHNMVLIQSYTCACVPVHKDIRKVHLHLSTWRGAPDIYLVKKHCDLQATSSGKEYTLVYARFCKQKSMEGGPPGGYIGIGGGTR